MSVYKDQAVIDRLEMQARHRAKLDALHRRAVQITAEVFRRHRRLVCRCAVCEGARQC